MRFLFIYLLLDEAAEFVSLYSYYSIDLVTLFLAMARSLLVLATCVAGALATMGMEMGMGATTITAPGSKITTTAGGNTIEIDVSVTIIEWSNGGGAAMNQVAPPSMAVGMTHYVSLLVLL